MSPLTTSRNSKREFKTLREHALGAVFLTELVITQGYHSSDGVKSPGVKRPLDAGIKNAVRIIPTAKPTDLSGFAQEHLILQFAQKAKGPANPTLPVPKTWRAW